MADGGNFINCGGENNIIYIYLNVKLVHGFVSQHKSRGKRNTLKLLPVTTSTTGSTTGSCRSYLFPHRHITVVPGWFILLWLVCWDEGV